MLLRGRYDEDETVMIGSGKAEVFDDLLNAAF